MTAFFLAALSVLSWVWGLFIGAFQLVAAVAVWAWRQGTWPKALLLVVLSAAVCSAASLCLGNPWYFSYLPPSAWAFVALAVVSIRLLDAP